MRQREDREPAFLSRLQVLASAEKLEFLRAVQRPVLKPQSERWVPRIFPWAGVPGEQKKASGEAAAAECPAAPSLSGKPVTAMAASLAEMEALASVATFPSAPEAAVGFRRKVKLLAPVLVRLQRLVAVEWRRQPRRLAGTETLESLVPRALVVAVS